jgi:hypothetical protein
MSFPGRYGAAGLRVGSSAVAKEDEYVLNGIDTLQLAERSASSRDKLRLLKLADGWLGLAERLRRRKSARRTAEHPLVKAKLGDLPRDG